MTDIGATFRALHVPGKPFILANVCDLGSAKMMASLGAQALATSSAAHAFTLGRPDGGTLSRDDALAHAQDIVAATPLPVQGDFENGFGDDPETCAETVRMSAEIGLAGICIEDIALPTEEAYDFDLAIERIKVAVSAARALPQDFVLTARADGIMLSAYDIDEAIRRLKAFEAAGADCLYAPLPITTADLAKIMDAVTAPVNVLIDGHYTQLDVATFAKMNVARLSLGSTLARVTHQAIYDAAQEMLQHVGFTRLGNGMSGDHVDALLTQK
jgi:2-methylisocitrate lyase-like PEP mutase family enzyme